MARAYTPTFRGTRRYSVELNKSSTTFRYHVSYLALAYRNDHFTNFFSVDDRTVGVQCGESRGITRTTEITQLNDEFLHVFHLFISG